MSTTVPASASASGSARASQPSLHDAVERVELAVRGGEVAVAVLLQHVLHAVGELLAGRLVERLVRADARVEAAVLLGDEAAVDLDRVDGGGELRGGEVGLAPVALGHGLGRLGLEAARRAEVAVEEALLRHLRARLAEQRLDIFARVVAPLGRGDLLDDHRLAAAARVLLALRQLALARREGALALGD